MPKTLHASLLAAAALLISASTANATTIFSNDFNSEALGSNERIDGNFSLADGYLGHHGQYNPYENSTYKVSLDLTNVTNAFLDFDYAVSTEKGYDYFQVFAGSTLLFGVDGEDAGHGHFVLGSLAGPTTLTFYFHSDYGLQYAGVRLDNVAVTGDVAETPAPVPEPASWALMVGGFGLVGGMARTSRRAISRRAFP